MLRNEYFVIGVMSGTSLDGIDLAYIRFNFDETWRFEILRAETISYSKEWIKTLSNLSKLEVEKIAEIDIAYTNYLGSVISDFILRNDILLLDFVASHGHTALHQPQSGLTYQIGNLKQLSDLVKTTIVCDFRTQDVALGGQGAPLVPIGDKLLFSEYDFCLNLGGFSNISFDFKGDRIAFDICAVNTVLNFYANQLGLEYDKDGELAIQGNLNEALLNELNQLEYYAQTFPKSLGIEYVNQVVLPLIEKHKIDVKDKLRTFTEHIAVQIGQQISSDNTANTSKILVTGGGAKNKFLVKRMAIYTPHKLIIPPDHIIDYKEALIFAFLGVLRLRNEINSLKSVTGAKIDHSSGKIYFSK